MFAATILCRVGSGQRYRLLSMSLLFDAPLATQPGCQAITGGADAGLWASQCAAFTAEAKSDASVGFGEQRAEAGFPQKLQAPL